MDGIGFHNPIQRPLTRMRIKSLVYTSIPHMHTPLRKHRQPLTGEDVCNETRVLCANHKWHCGEDDKENKVNLIVGIDNDVVGSDGTRSSDGESSLRVIDENSWRTMLSCLPEMGLQCNLIKPPGCEKFASELMTVNADSRESGIYTVMYYGVDFVDNDQGEGSGDPRADILPRVLSGIHFDWAYVYVFAHINKEESVPEPEPYRDNEDYQHTVEYVAREFVRSAIGEAVSRE